MQVFIKINLIILLIFFYIECASSSSNHRRSRRSTNENGESSRHRSRNVTSPRTEQTGITLVRYISRANVSMPTHTSRAHTRPTIGTNLNRSRATASQSTGTGNHQRESNRYQHRRRDDDDHENVRRTIRFRQPEVIHRPRPRVSLPRFPLRPSPSPPSPSPSPSPPPSLSRRPPILNQYDLVRYRPPPPPRLFPNENDWNQYLPSRDEYPYRPPAPPRLVTNESDWYSDEPQRPILHAMNQLQYRPPTPPRPAQYDNDRNQNLIPTPRRTPNPNWSLPRQVRFVNNLSGADQQIPLQAWDESNAQFAIRFRQFAREYRAIAMRRLNENDIEVLDLIRRIENEILLQEPVRTIAISDTSRDSVPPRTDGQSDPNSDNSQDEIEGRPVCMKCNQTIIIHPEPIVMVLLCGHTYCKNCTDTLFRHSRYVHCPNCSQTVYERDNLRAYFEIDRSNRSSLPITTPINNPNLTQPQRPNESNEHFRRRTAAARAAENRIRNPNMDAPTAPITIPNRQSNNEQNNALAYPPVQITFDQQPNERERQLARTNATFSKPKCPICLQTIVLHPRTVNILRCGHTFCNNCLVSHYQHPMSNGTVTCPICRTEITRDTYRQVLFKFDNRSNAVSHH